MRKIGIVILLCILPAIAGCDDKDARDYANELTKVLTTYQEQVETKVAAEKDSYSQLAKVYERARQRNIEQMLETDRVESSKKLATAMAQADYLPRNTEIAQSLNDYADRDFAATQEFLQVEADAMAQFLGDIEALEFETETIDELGSALKLLAKPKGQIKRIKDAADFAKGAKAEFDKLVCNDIATALKAQTETLNTLRAEQTSLQTKLSSLNDAKPRDHQAISLLREEMKLKGAEIDTMMRESKSLTDQQSNCPK